MSKENKGIRLPESQRELVNLVVKKTLERHKVKSNEQLSPEDKKEIRTIYNKLQSEVNEFLKASGQPELPIINHIEDEEENKRNRRAKRGRRLR